MWVSFCETLLLVNEEGGTTPSWQKIIFHWRETICKNNNLQFLCQNDDPLSSSQESGNGTVLKRPSCHDCALCLSTTGLLAKKVSACLHVCRQAETAASATYWHEEKISLFGKGFVLLQQKSLHPSVRNSFL